MMKKIDVKFINPYNNCILRKIIFHQYLLKLISIFDLMGALTDRFRYEVFQNLILSPMNTGFIRPAVATVLTVYGIETSSSSFVSFSIFLSCNSTYRLRYWNFPLVDSYIIVICLLQQYLPFTVLKLTPLMICVSFNSCNSTYRLRYWNIL